MSFKYINPGYVQLLDANTPANQVRNSSICSNGVGFWQSNSNYGTTISNFEGNEIWTKFEFYLPSNTSLSIKEYIRGKQNGVGIFCSSGSYGSVQIQPMYQNTAYSHVSISASPTPENTTPIKNATGLILDSINSVWLYYNYDEHYLDLQINDKKLDRWNYRNFYVSNGLFVFSSNNASAPISNVIISDKYINPKETVIALPISSTESNMTFDSDNGIYTATANNQTLFSAVDVDFLCNEYGSDSTVTGIASIGNPAYKTANELTTLTALSKDNSGIVTEYNSYSLGSDSTSMILDSRKISTDTTISDLQNFKFGWKAGT